jgi:hypothetical protein
MYSTVGQVVELLACYCGGMGSIPIDRSYDVNSLTTLGRYFMDLPAFLQRPDTSPGRHFFCPAAPLQIHVDIRLDIRLDIHLDIRLDIRLDI